VPAVRICATIIALPLKGIPTLAYLPACAHHSPSFFPTKACLREGEDQSGRGAKQTWEQAAAASTRSSARCWRHANCRAPHQHQSLPTVASFLIQPLPRAQQQPLGVSSNSTIQDRRRRLIRPSKQGDYATAGLRNPPRLSSFRLSIAASESSFSCARTRSKQQAGRPVRGGAWCLARQPYNLACLPCLPAKLSKITWTGQWNLVAFRRCRRRVLGWVGVGVGQMRPT
jgi:hypothetical protein